MAPGIQTAITRKRKFRKCFFGLLRHSGKLLILGGVLLGIAMLYPGKGHFGNDIARMLPDGSDSMAIYTRIGDSTLFSKAMILLSADRREAFTDPHFIRKYHALAGKLSLQKRFIRQVDYRLFLPGSPEENKSLFLYAASCSDPSELPPPGKLLRDTWKQLIMPSSTGRSEMIRLDPAGLLKKIYLPLQKFRNITGHSAALDSAFIMTEDHKNVLMILETVLPPSDPRSGRELEKILLDGIAQASFPPEIRCELILPHRRAVANEEVVRQDVKLSILLSVIFFALITVLLYRGDLRSFLIIALPALASLGGGAITVLLFDDPQLYVLGLGGVIVSIAVDYGIHIYSCMKTPLPCRTLYKLMPSLLAGMFTSAGAYFMFVFSSMEAVRQLGFFSFCSLFLSLLLMILVLPAVLRKGKEPHRESLPCLMPEKIPEKLIRYLFASVWMISLCALPFLTLKMDVRQYDLSPPELQQQEQKVNLLFRQGKSCTAVLFEGESAAEALERSARFCGEKGIFSPAEILPGKEFRDQNLTRWKAFDLERYGSALRKEGRRYGFSDRFFDPFLQTLEKLRKAETAPELPTTLTALKDKLLVRGRSGTWYCCAMLDEKLFPQARLRELTKHGIMISPDHVPKIMAQDIMKGILPCGCAALLAVLLLTTLYFRSLKDALLSLLPAGSALLVSAGIFALTGKEVNIPVLAGWVILCGLSVDYGIFVLYAVRRKKEDLIFRSITLSALTTLAGGLTVAFARHPMLSDGGLTLICGITLTWATALFFLPQYIRRKAVK